MCRARKGAHKQGPAHPTGTHKARRPLTVLQRVALVAAVAAAIFSAAGDIAVKAHERLSSAVVRLAHNLLKEKFRRLHGLADPSSWLDAKLMQSCQGRGCASKASVRPGVLCHAETWLARRLPCTENAMDKAHEGIGLFEYATTLTLGPQVWVTAAHVCKVIHCWWRTSPRCMRLSCFL